MTTKITLMEGDGIGPEVTGAVQKVFQAANVAVEWERVEAGARVFKKGIATGVPKETLDSIERNKIALKGPLETPVGYGEKSANVTLRKLFELYGNIRPTREIPGVPGLFAGRIVDLIVVRENVEDLYAGVEHMQTPSVAQCLKLISRKGCEKIVRLAFELARAESRKKVHCATKSNIMKLTEGMLKRTFEEIAPEYSEIKTEHIIIDNCAHQLVRYPEQFDVIVTTNMNGDIISDLTSGLTGGLGLAPSANIGNGIAMFEAVHGSAPTIAGKDIANPTAMLLSSVLLLRYIGEFEKARDIEHAVVLTIEEGKKLTVDLAASQEVACSTTAFTDEVIKNLGRRSDHWPDHDYKPLKLPTEAQTTGAVKVSERKLVGVDIFIEADDTPAALGAKLEAVCEQTPLKLKMIGNRGTMVYPGSAARTDCVDHWRCCFTPRKEGAETSDAEILALLTRVSGKFRWMHVEKLELHDGKPGYTKSQGED
ncbi:MAG: NADP-dependent isocitrate dehydrogenase [Phycisphaerae bacterium]